MLLLAIIAEPQLAGASTLAGIGFTMSLFIASQAFADPGDFATARIAVFPASIGAALLGAAMLWSAADKEAKPNDRAWNDSVPQGFCDGREKGVVVDFKALAKAWLGASA